MISNIFSRTFLLSLSDPLILCTIQVTSCLDVQGSALTVTNRKRLLYAACAACSQLGDRRSESPITRERGVRHPHLLKNRGCFLLKN